MIETLTPEGVWVLAVNALNIEGSLTYTFVDLDKLDEAVVDFESDPRLTNVVEDRPNLKVVLDYAESA